MIRKLIEDTIVQIDTYHEEQTVRITVEYGSRGSICSETYEIPLSVLEAPDMINAAIIHGLNVKLQWAEDQLQIARENVAHFEHLAAQYNERLAEVNNKR